jgi:hypothetical protein
MKLATGQNMGTEICDILGLEHCNLLDIHIGRNEFVTITARFIPEVDEMNQVVEVVKKYRLMEIPKEKKECNHDKVYSDCILTSLPPMFPWICRKCGAKGSERGKNIMSEYNKIEKEFA